MSTLAFLMALSPSTQSQTPTDSGHVPNSFFSLASSTATPNPDLLLTNQVNPLELLDLDPFYKQYVWAGPIPVIASDKPPRAAMLEAKRLVQKMTENSNLVRTVKGRKINFFLEALKELKVRAAVISKDEHANDIPEHAHVPPELHKDGERRGFGPTLWNPAASAPEENLLCYGRIKKSELEEVDAELEETPLLERNSRKREALELIRERATERDPYHGQSVFIHEFAHAIYLTIKMRLPSLHRKLTRAYENAMQAGIWDNTYAATNEDEYLAELTQIWFEANRKGVEGGDETNNHIHTRKELKEYDPAMAAILEKLYGDSDWRYECPNKNDTVDPFAPAGTLDSAAQTSVSNPVIQGESEKPADQSDSNELAGESDADDSVDKSDSKDPVDSDDQLTPSTPADQLAASNATDQSGSTDPADQTDSVDSSDSNNSSDQAASNAPTDATDSTAEDDPNTVDESIVALALDPFYKRHIKAGPLNIVSSGQVSREALNEAKNTIINITKHDPKLMRLLAALKIKVALLAEDEEFTDIPEYAGTQPVLSGSPRRSHPPSMTNLTLVAPEENLLCSSSKTGEAYEENIFIEELAQAIYLSIRRIRPAVLRRISNTYKDSIGRGLWRNTYAADSEAQYFAELTQIWFEANREGAQGGDGMNNHINTRDELRAYDPQMAEILLKVYGDLEWRYKCPSENQ